MNIKFEDKKLITSGRGAEKVLKPLNLFSDKVSVSLYGVELPVWAEADDEKNTVLELKIDETGVTTGHTELTGDVKIMISSGNHVIYTTPSPEEKFPVFKLLLKPTGAMLQVRLIEDQKIKTTDFGIVLAEKQPERTRIAEVLASGPGQYNPQNGGYFKPTYQPGDLVYINSHSPTNAEVKHLTLFANEPLSYMIHENDVMGIYLSYTEAAELDLVARRF